MHVLDKYIHPGGKVTGKIDFRLPILKEKFRLTSYSIDTARGSEGMRDFVEDEYNPEVDNPKIVKAREVLDQFDFLYFEYMVFELGDTLRVEMDCHDKSYLGVNEFDVFCSEELYNKYSDEFNYDFVKFVEYVDKRTRLEKFVSDGD